MRGFGREVCNLLQDTYFFVETGNDIMNGGIGDDKYHRLFFDRSEFKSLWVKFLRNLINY